ncbi:hypothetical protein [Silvanigrella sp.]|jgi:hypothetical protein|uniref:hypothetical protein n=1 Tax=Silvanigrella sp. TaxID=2024976 RepID=UPI0037C97F54
MKWIKIFLLLNICIFIVSHIYADTKYVICASVEKSWNWLLINNQYVLVSVEIQGHYENINEDIYSIVYYFTIPREKAEEFKNECLKQFGPSYRYAQVADNRYSEWILFGNEENVFGGVAKIHYCFFRSTQTSSHDSCIPRIKIIEP